MQFIQGGIFDPTNKLIRDVITISPPKSIKQFMYRCDKRFHTESLLELYQVNDPYGAILINGERTEFYTLDGTTPTLIYKYYVDLPKNQDRDGQSSVRFSRLRTEAIHNYITKVIEKSVELFTKDGLPTINGLFIVGTADKKILLKERLDPRLKRVLLGVLTDSEIKMTSILGLIDAETNKGSKIFQQEINELMALSPELLVYGTDVRKLDEQHLLKTIYYQTFNQKETKFNCQGIRKVNDLSKYNQMIGIRYVADYQE